MGTLRRLDRIVCSFYDYMVSLVANTWDSLVEILSPHLLLVWLITALLVATLVAIRWFGRGHAI